MSLVLVFIPGVAFAALGGLNNLLYDFGGLIGNSVRVIFGLAFVFFFWGMAQFILKDAGNEKTRADGQKKMIWGIIALFVMFSIYGILKLIGDLTGIQPGNSQTSNRSGLYTPQQGGYKMGTFGN